MSTVKRYRSGTPSSIIDVRVITIIDEKAATDSLKYRIRINIVKQRVLEILDDIQSDSYCKFKSINLCRNFMDPGCTYFRLTLLQRT